MSPRVFISAPTENASRHGTPVARAASVEPPSFPPIAAASTSAHAPHASAPCTSPSDVRTPVSAKKTGSSTVVTAASSRSATSRAKSAWRGITAPARNAPNSACTPIHSVASAEASATTTARATRVAGVLGADAPVNARRSAGRATNAANAAYAATPATAPSAAGTACPARATATTAASRHHAVTSSTAALAIAIAPARVFSRPRSVRMRASTGNAVTLIAAPTNAANVRSDTPSPASCG